MRPLRTILDLGDDELQLASPRTVAAMGRCVVNGEGPPKEAGEIVSAWKKFGSTVPSATQIFVHRLGDFVPLTPVSGTLCGTITVFSEDNPGRLVLWAHATAAYWARSGQPVTVAALFGDHLGWRLPTESALHALWVEQKVHGVDQEEYPTFRGNWLDHPPAWKRETLTAYPLRVDRH